MHTGVIPTFRYSDVTRAVDFLIDAFEFERHSVYEDAGRILHAELSHGNGMVMLGPVADDDYGANFTSVSQVSKPTSSVYVLVEDPYAHAERARAAGAEIVMEPRDQDYGGANYSARDPEGFIWNFGSYDPWAPEG